MEFGFNSPILCDMKLRILAGHTRWKAAIKMRLKEVPVIRLNLTETQKKAFAIADNKTAEIAKWDFPVLAEIVQELQFEDFDLDFTGFSEQEVEALVFSPPELDWSEFEETLMQNSHSAYFHLLVKIPVKQKETLKKTIREVAVKLHLSNNDKGMLNGLIFQRLLEMYND